MSVFLALLHNVREVGAFNDRALHVSQSRHAKLVRRFERSELVFRDGRVHPVVEIQHIRHRRSVLPWPMDWVTLAGEREIRVVLGDPIEIEIASVRKTVAEYIRAEGHLEEWLQEGKSCADLFASLSSAKDFEQLFDTLGLGSDEDGLDVLC